MTVRVAVVGGGLAGLFTANQLVAQGVDDVVLLDRNDQPGGVARTIRRDGYELEPAAGTLLLPHPHLTPMLQTIGAAVTPAAPAAAHRFVYSGGRMVSIPSSPKAALAPFVSWPAKLRAAAEPLVMTEPSSIDESLTSFLERRFGAEAGKTLSWLAASGVFAGDPSQLSARSAFPAFPALEDDAGSIVRGGIRRLKNRAPGATRPAAYIPAGGMTGLAEAAATKLGDRYRPGSRISVVSHDSDGWTISGKHTFKAETLVLAVSPHDAASLLGGNIGEALERAVSAPVVVIGFGGPADGFPLPDGFGMLTGPDAGKVTRGVLFESSYAPGRAPEGHSLVKVIAGGAVRPDVVDWSDERLTTEIGHEVSAMLGTPIDASFVEIVRHRQGIPQYNVGHADWLDELRSLTKPLGGLHLTGWGYRGIGVAHQAAEAARVASLIETP